MAHGTPVGIADNDERYGAQGAFLIEAGISSSYLIANFFGLTDRVRQPKAVSRRASKEAKQTIAVAPSVPARTPDLATVLWPRATLNRHPEPPPEPQRRGIDVGAVITRALTAAGLMK